MRKAGGQGFAGVKGSKRVRCVYESSYSPPARSAVIFDLCVTVFLCASSAFCAPCVRMVANVEQLSPQRMMPCRGRWQHPAPADLPPGVKLHARRQDSSILTHVSAGRSDQSRQPSHVETGKMSVSLPRAPASLLPAACAASCPQVGRSLLLLGKHRQALEVLEEVSSQEGSSWDWELWYSRGLSWVQAGEAAR